MNHPLGTASADWRDRLAERNLPTPCGCCGGSGIWWASLDETVTVVCVDCDGTGIEGEDR